MLLVQAPAIGRSFSMQLSSAIAIKISCFDDSVELVAYFRGRAVYFATPLGAPN